jgi:hypothetical protein
MNEMPQVDECDHIKNNGSPARAAINLGPNRVCMVCLTCYQGIKATVLEPLVEKALDNVVRRMIQTKEIVIHGGDVGGETS